MSKQLTAKQTVLAKYGAVPTAADAITLSDFTFVNPEVSTLDYKDVGLGTLGSQKSIVNTDLTTVALSLQTNLRATPAGTPPKVAELYKICGLEEAVDTTNNVVTYTPAQVFPSTGTIVTYIDGTKRTIEGAVGTLKIDFNVGELVKASFDLQGFTDAEPVLEANPTITLDGNDLFIVKSVDAVTVGGTTIPLTTATFDFGVDIKQFYAIGMKEYGVMDYAPTITVNQFKDKGNEQHWSDLSAGLVKEFKISLTAPNGGVLELVAPNAKLKQLNESDDSGAVALSRTYSLEAGDNTPNFTITYK